MADLFTPVAFLGYDFIPFCVARRWCHSRVVSLVYMLRVYSIIITRIKISVALSDHNSSIKDDLKGGKHVRNEIVVEI